jgi:branched-subunit amino acid transport protein AzlD
MPETTNILAVLVITFSITFATSCAFCCPWHAAGVHPGRRTLPMDARWRLGILAVAAFRGSVVGLPGRAIYAAPALAVTIAVHLLCGRCTLLSVTLGTATFVSLVNLL